MIGLSREGREPAAIWCSGGLVFVGFDNLSILAIF